MFLTSAYHRIAHYLARIKEQRHAGSHLREIFPIRAYGFDVLTFEPGTPKTFQLVPREAGFDKLSNRPSV